MDYKAEQEMEVEALESILMDDFAGAHTDILLCCVSTTRFYAPKCVVHNTQSVRGARAR